MQVKTDSRIKIALFGSAFNPPSLGHKGIIESLTHYDRVLLVPSISHAWGKSMLDYDIRCQMVELLIKQLNCDNVQLCRVEESLFHNNGAKLIQVEQADHTPQLEQIDPVSKAQKEKLSVTTFAVLQAIQEQYPNAELTFVIGPDNFINFTKFYKYEQILSRWSVLVSPEKFAIRSSLIRERIANGKSIADLTSSLVEQYIQQHKLYC